MATIQLTKDNFDETVSNNDVVIIDFWAQWCAPCRSFAPIFETASDDHPDIVFGKVNTEEEQELAAAFQVRSIPMVMVFREQIVLYAQPGMLGESQLKRLIDQTKEIDMDKVREEVEKERQGKQA